MPQHMLGPIPAAALQPAEASSSTSRERTTMGSGSGGGGGGGGGGTLAGGAAGTLRASSRSLSVW